MQRTNNVTNTDDQQQHLTAVITLRCCYCYSWCHSDKQCYKHSWSTTTPHNCHHAALLLLLQLMPWWRNNTENYGNLMQIVNCIKVNCDSCDSINQWRQPASTYQVWSVWSSGHWIHVTDIQIPTQNLCCPQPVPLTLQCSHTLSHWILFHSQITFSKSRFLNHSKDQLQQRVCRD